MSGLWLLHGSPRATITTIDSEPEHLGAARAAFIDARVPAARARFITGRASDVLPRMNEASYDIVFIDAEKDDYERLFELARPKVEPGGLFVADNVLSHEETLGAYSRARQADPTLESVTVPLDRGLELSVVLQPETPQVGD